MTEEKNIQPHYIGHRERLRKKLLESDGNVFADYELLELLLTIAIPRRDVKPLAKELLQKFSTFAGVINAPVSELLKIKGIGETTISMFKIVNLSMARVLMDKAKETSVISNWQELINYCQLNIGNKQTEEFHILYLDTKCHLIKDETHTTGTINTSSVYPREILKRVLEVGASSVIIVHNHPTGDTTPSNADISITRKIKESLKTIDVPLHDHLIVGKGNYFSFKSFGIL
ncbi:MAG: DNA repair protein RadC [Alphaproteobacteria bacterium]|nr:DNA repair protein RadC [Alphaproteobacteria bacterium]